MKAEMALCGTTCAATVLGKDESLVTASMGERALLVAGPAPHSRRRVEDDAAQAPLPAQPAGGKGETRRLTVVTHALKRGLEFGTLPVQGFHLAVELWRRSLGVIHRGAASFVTANLTLPQRYSAIPCQSPW